MKTSINQLRLELADILEGHLQMNTFFWGDFPRAVNEENINYPLMASYYPTAGLLDNQTSLPITIVIADKIYEDYTNLNDVESDTLQYCRDVFNIMNKSTRWQKLGRVESCSLTKFIEGNADVCAGHIMTVNFTLRDSNSICDLPMSGYDFDQDIASSCLPVQIYRNGVLVDTVASGGTYSYTTDAFTYTIKNTNNATLYSGTVTANLSVTIQDCTVSNSDASYSATVTAEGNLTLPDITINAVNSDLTELASNVVPSVIDATLNIPDITFTDSNGTVSSVPAGVDIVATTCEVPTYTYATKKLFKTMTTTSQRPNDDGDLERGMDFFTIDAITGTGTAIDGNTTRFLGTANTAVFTNGIIIDWSTFNGSTVLGYYKFDSSNTDYASQETAVNALSPAGFSGWGIANAREILNVAQIKGSGAFSWSPLSYPTSGSIYSSSLQSATSTYYFVANTASMDVLGTITAFLRVIPVRNFTLAELGL